MFPLPYCIGGEMQSVAVEELDAGISYFCITVVLVGGSQFFHERLLRPLLHAHTNTWAGGALVPLAIPQEFMIQSFSPCRQFSRSLWQATSRSLPLTGDCSIRAQSSSQSWAACFSWWTNARVPTALVLQVVLSAVLHADSGSYGAHLCGSPICTVPCVSSA